MGIKISPGASERLSSCVQGILILLIYSKALDYQMLRNTPVGKIFKLIVSEISCSLVVWSCQLSQMVDICEKAWKEYSLKRNGSELEGIMVIYGMLTVGLDSSVGVINTFKPTDHKESCTHVHTRFFLGLWIVHDDMLPR